MTIFSIPGCSRLLLAGLFLAWTGCGVDDGDGASASPAADADAEQEIRDLLQDQVEAWNLGSIPGFMDGYARTDTLRFASGGNVWRGWDQTLQRYEEAYPDEGSMGALNFSDLDIWSVSEDYAVAFGRWHLRRSESFTSIGGLFTLVLERGPDGWQIVHDHTSSREEIETQDRDTADVEQEDAEPQQ